MIWILEKLVQAIPAIVFIGFMWILVAWLAPVYVECLGYGYSVKYCLAVVF